MGRHLWYAAVVAIFPSSWSFLLFPVEWTFTCVCCVKMQVGSDSAQGAGGPVMRDTITRVARLLAQVGRSIDCSSSAVLQVPYI
jgi:hypothetical protein